MFDIVLNISQFFNNCFGRGQDKKLNIKEFTQSLKYNIFKPWMGYLSKNGIILLIISSNFVTTK